LERLTCGVAASARKMKCKSHSANPQIWVTPILNLMRVGLGRTPSQAPLRNLRALPCNKLLRSPYVLDAYSDAAGRCSEVVIRMYSEIARSTPRGATRTDPCEINCVFTAPARKSKRRLLSPCGTEAELPRAPGKPAKATTAQRRDRHVWSFADLGFLTRLWIFKAL
jgi:hypothetical protein